MVRPLSLARPLAVLLAASLPLPAAAERVRTYSGEYVVSYLGFTVARSTFRTRIEGDSFAIDGTVASAGIAQIFDRTRGTSSASGSLAGALAQPKTFRMDYTEGKRKQTTALTFDGGTVTEVHNEPPLKKRGADWVKLRPQDLKGAVDPLSAGLLKAKGPEAVCGRTLKLFDGEMRMDATLHPVDRPPAVEGYGDGLVACRVTVKPVSGYRKGRRALDYLEKRSRILVTFAPLGSSGLYAPVHATIGTPIGTVTLKARNLASAD
jgi:hypothetical protein